MERMRTRDLLLTLAAYSAILAAAWALTPGLVDRFYPLPVDQGPAWYFWQRGNPTTASHLSAWIGYGLHQLFVWIVVGLRMTNRIEPRTYRRWFLGGNLAFIILHLVQTHGFYDGLAQDVPIWTSQGSVIVMLVLMMTRLIPRRGIIFGKSFALPPGLTRFLDLFHGPYIAWALVYTFWFHPMDMNWGLLSGFAYMFLLFIQMQAAESDLHFRGWWLVLLESFVAIHGTLITVFKHNEIWPMFLFGFLFVTVFTSIYMLKVPRWLPRVLQGFYVVAALLVYGLIRGFSHAYEISFIPVALYGGTLALYGVGWIVARLTGAGTGKAQASR